ncbi:MAG: tRNA (guanosine(46)-N7)-methyltransferase TrmB [Rhodospirillales bacterium]|nr:tRNA (guanosine(46)-N7)-methyltransferase TrmB [Rhodospirillales bacterium]
MTDSRTPVPQHPRFYGRRRGHRLRQGRQALLDRLLPDLRIALPPAPRPLDPASLFAPRPPQVWLEIGFGAGEHLVGQATAHPDVGLIGCEPFVNGVASLLARIQDEGISNIRIFDDDARLLLPRLAAASIGRVFLLFSDPWPKKRHQRRRIVTPGTLDEIARLLADGGEFRFATDHAEYVRWTLDLLTRHPDFMWLARTPRDWRERPEDGFETRYEAKAKVAESACVFLRFQRRPRG